jgi:hypothetical protein
LEMQFKDAKGNLLSHPTEPDDQQDSKE